MSMPTNNPPPKQRRDPAGVRAQILSVATAEFVQHGFGGARVEEIAARIHTTKRMIYYYFDSKENLFASVTDSLFTEFCRREARLEMAGMDPVSAMRAYAEDRFDAYVENGDLVRLLAIENARTGDHLAARAAVQPGGTNDVDIVTEALERGVSAGVFRADIDSVEVRILAASYSSFRTVFRSTVNTMYGRDMLDAKGLGLHRRLAGEALVAILTTFPHRP